jgi:hypothetical protein
MAGKNKKAPPCWRGFLYRLRGILRLQTTPPSGNNNADDGKQGYVQRI